MTLNKAIAIAAFLLASAGSVAAQQQRDGNQPVDKKTEKSETNAPTTPGASGPVKDERPTDPQTPKQGEIQKLDKEGRGGQQK
jgi:hypothetical protein